MSASEALNLYFPSTSAPTPNRMNWKNEQTDAWLRQARTTTDEGVKRDALASVQRQLTEASVWIPLVREQLWVVSGRRAHGVRAHGIYGMGIYKGLDITLTS